MSWMGLHYMDALMPMGSSQDLLKYDRRMHSTLNTFFTKRCATDCKRRRLLGVDMSVGSLEPQCRSNPDDFFTKRCATCCKRSMLHGVVT